MSYLKTPPPLSASLDAVDYDPVEHLNAMFSHPATLSATRETSQALFRYQEELDQDLARLLISQSAVDAENLAEMQTAKLELAELFQRIDSVRSKASHTELTITEMTADIKRLDNTKRNLTLSMTALKRLQMLTAAFEQLHSLSKTRQYGDCSQLLQAVIQLMAHFKSYRSIDQIATLSRNVVELQHTLLEQICEDFEITFAKSEISQRKSTLTEACLVMDALGEHARARLINWYCNTQLREYRHLFSGNEEAGSLDNISRRYSWFKRIINTYDEEHATIFPGPWRVNEALANSFCEGTRDDFKAILARTARRTDGKALDVDLLLSCLKETLDFEQSLDAKFANGGRMSIDTMSSKDDQGSIFSKAISEAFEPYLSLWVESQDKQLSNVITKYRQQPIIPADEEFSPQSVIPSSIELFHFYRSTLAQCAKISTGNRLLELSHTFAKYLEQYAEKILLSKLRDRTNGPEQLLQQTILVLNTADYCHTTCSQLEEKVKSRIDEDLRSKVDFQSQADSFMGVASAALRNLVRKVENDCETGWREMRNTSWGKMAGVSDQSSYVAELLNKFNATGSEILKLLAKPQYSRAFCDNVVEMMVNYYIANLGLCKPISETGAEQMLLDSYVLKKGFGELLTINAEQPTSIPPGYLKRVAQSMSKLDPLLKTLQVQPNPPEGLVQAYLIHIGDKSEANFKKILELKGVSRNKSEQAQLVELFHAHSAAHENLMASSPILSPLQIVPVTTASTSSTSSSMAASAGGSSFGHQQSLSLSGSAGRFDPATFGSAIMSAARDGVDRLGTPTLGGSSNTPSGAASPQILGLTGTSGVDGVGIIGGAGATAASSTAAGNLNENLRNIGKFFRRDMGTTFSGKWGGSGGAASSTGAASANRASSEDAGR